MSRATSGAAPAILDLSCRDTSTRRPISSLLAGYLVGYCAHVDGQPEIVHHDDPAFAPVLAALTVEYARRYGQHDATTDASAADFAPPDGALLIIRVDGRTVSAGGFRRVDATACELKRMWTAADQRRRGHARRILAALEDLAAACGYRTIRLETGPAQPEAITLYQSVGYLPDPQNVRHVGATALIKRLHRGNVAG